MKPIWIFGIAIHLVLGNGSVVNGKEQLSITFLPEVSVPGPKILWSDIAQIQGPEIIVAALGKEEVGKAANYGGTRHLSTRRVVASKQREDVRGTYAIQVKNPEVSRIKVHTLSSTLQADELASWVEEFLTQCKESPSSQVEFELIDPPEKIFLPTDPYTKEIRAGVGFDCKGRQALELRLVKPGYLTRRIPFGAKVRLYDSVWVAKKRIPRGTFVVPSMFDRVYREITYISSPLLQNIETVVGKKNSQTLIAGRILLSRYFPMEPVVHTGDAVKVQVRQGGILIWINGIARENGVPGQVIRVKSLMSHQLIRAKVLEAGKLVWTSSRV